MKLGRIGGNTDRTDWSGIYSPSDNLSKIHKSDNIENYVWRRNYSFGNPFFHILRPSISYGDNDTKIYISDGNTATNQEIRQYNLTKAGDASTASYSNNSVSVRGSSGNSDLNTTFSPDGTRMYISFYFGSTVIFQPPEQYNLSTAWDISTAVPKVKKFNVASQEANPHGIYVKPDGTKMYIVGNTGDDINEYNISTAYDISTASYLQNFSVSSQDSSPLGVEFKPDGTKMYVVGLTGRDINEYNLSTAWDVTTASYNQNFSVGGQETSPYSVRFKPDGTKMFVTGTNGDDINEYSLSTAWDVSTASFVQSFATGDSNQKGVTFSDDGTKMYTSGGTLDGIKEWDLSTAWSLSTVTFVQQTGNLVEGISGIQLLDDDKMYVVSAAANVETAFLFTLNTDKDIRSIDGVLLGDSTTDNNQYDVLAGVGISSDGTKFFVLDRDNADRITEFSLPTPYELTGATRTGNFIYINTSTSETSPLAIHFSKNGTKIYVGGGTNTRCIYQYNLSTAWDITTNTLFKQRLNLFSQPNTTTSNYDTLTQARYYGAGQLTDVEGLAFTQDGTSVLICTEDNYTEFKLPVN
jgi:hypothetical protein